MKHVIVGTAGHIDHGKTALVKALTGVDTDRLKEEKLRGITIDIGFAELADGDIRIGFVDVPGHERFIKNMLAGAHGIDLVLLVVAADESIMPQTREHFDICKLLDVKAGLIALTKSDLVDAELMELVRSDVEEFVQGSFLEYAPVIAVSSRTGAGIPELRKTLFEIASTVNAKTTSAIPRIPIDRAFSVRGFGTVITGTLISGEIRTGDELELLPAGKRTRARNIQVHGSDAERAFAGQRTAINLQGIDISEVARGMVITKAGQLGSSTMIDVWLEVLPSAPRPLMTRSRVRLHHGTAEIMCRAVVLRGSDRYDLVSRPTQAYQIEPGGSGLVQLRLEEPITALPNDRFIIRSYSPQVTIGGGIVLDGHPEKHRIRDVEAVKFLDILKQASPLERVAQFIRMASIKGISAEKLCARTGLTDRQLTELSTGLVSSGDVIEVSGNPTLLLIREAYEQLAASVVDMLTEHHQREPLAYGLSREELRDRVFGGLPIETFRAVISRMVDQNLVTAEKETLRLSSHKPALSAQDEVAKHALEALYLKAGLQALTIEEAAASAGVPPELARKLFNLLAVEKRVIKLGDLVFHVHSIDSLKSRVREHKSISSKIDVAAFKEITGGVSRKYAIPLLEYLDREKVTRRTGNEREIL